MRKNNLLLITFILFFTMANAENPFFKVYDTPYGTIPFDKIRNEHYEPAFEAGMEAHMGEIERIIADPSVPDFSNTIEALEFSGELLEKVSYVFFNMLSAESDDELMEIAQRVQPKLTEHNNNIRLNNDLFVKIREVYEKRESLQLDTEQMRLLTETYDRFANNGGNLNEEDKVKYRELSAKLGMLTLQFGQNVLKATNAYAKVLTEEQLAGLPEGVKEAAAQKAKQKGKEGYMVDLTAPLYIPFMKYADTRELRKELYTAYNTNCMGGEYDNTKLIQEIVSLRYEIAALLGYENYASQVLRRRMAANSENVYALLNDLLVNYKPAAQEDYLAVSRFAEETEGKAMQVMPYDWSYYSEKLKDSKFNINEEQIREYFELENVKKGVFGLATALYGIRFEKNNSIPVYNEEVDVYEVFDKDGSFLAVLYTDFHPRESKRSGAWMSEFKAQYKKDGINSRPHIMIVMNFTRPTSTKPALLTFDEVNTFLHEFGHALHGIFADTRYPGLSGTSVYRDFVELPSQFMENYLREKSYLDQFALHYRTGEKIPAEWVDNLVAASNFNAGYLCLRQLSFGFLDMAYHTLSAPYAGDVTLFEKEAISEAQVLPVVEGTAMSPSFQHIFSGGYAAGYYSYKWAEVLDADAYALFRERGIFDRETAGSFRENILSRGGTEDPMELYIRFRGQKPTVEALMQRDGILK